MKQTQSSRGGVHTPASPSRRALLRSSAAGLGLAACLPDVLLAQAPAAQLSTLLPNLPEVFSTAERDRRWSRTREAMKKAGYDCLLTPAGGGESNADSVYLTQRPGWVIFPGDGPVVAVTESGDRGQSVAGHWRDRSERMAHGDWSPSVITALKDLKMQKARIGVGRLQGVLRNAEGDVSYTTLQRIKDALPDARFESAADLLMRVKLLRSQEEIAVMRLAAEAGERGIKAMIDTARPGIHHKDIWIAVFTAMTGSTGEPPARLAMRAGDEANTSGGGPLIETIQAGQVMNQEIAASVLNYMAQVNQSICVGRPAPADWESAAKYCIDVFHEMVDWIKPGKLYIDLCRFYDQRVKARAKDMQPDWVVVHTCGLGDSPRMGVGRTETLDLVIEPTMVFTIKPRVRIEGTTPTVQFGDPLLVTERGAERLGKRTLEALTVG